MCILVVEDNALIRLILVEELLEAGYAVRESETGDQALRMLGTFESPLTLLVTDVHMPGSCDGIDLAAHVRARYPDVPIIYTTGRPDALTRVTKLDDRQFLVRKPYVPGEVISRVQCLLGH